MNQFHLSPQNLPNLVDKLKQLDPTRKWVVSWSEKKSKRSLEQNSRYHKLITELGKHLGYEHDEMHDIVRFKFLRNRIEIEGEAFPLLKSTTKLTTIEMMELQDAIERWGVSLGFVMEWAE